MSPITLQSPIQFNDPLPSDADIVIVGAGIIGICTAWYLCAQGYKVFVCEKGRVAGEQSSRNWGWTRQQGRDEAELPIVMESLRLWDTLGAESGVDLGFRREGSLYLCENDEELARHDEFLNFSTLYGLESHRLTRNKLESLIKDCPSRWRNAVYTPSDGRAEPETAVPALAQACSRKGVGIRENCAVRAVSSSNAEVDGVYTEDGFIRCARVLCCAGAWSSRLLRQSSIDLPQLTVKATVASTEAAPPIFCGNAAGSGLSFRHREDGGYTIAMTDYLEVIPDAESFRQLAVFLPMLKQAYKKINLRAGENWVERFITSKHWQPDQETPFERERVLNPQPTPATLRRLRQRLNNRLPQLSQTALKQAWSGMIDATPDAVPVMDQSNQVGGLFIATGFSGHGFGIGPGAGKIMAALIQNKTVEYDLDRFRLSRFSDGSKLRLGPSI